MKKLLFIFLIAIYCISCNNKEKEIISESKSNVAVQINSNDISQDEDVFEDNEITGQEYFSYSIKDNSEEFISNIFKIEFNETGIINSFTEFISEDGIDYKKHREYKVIKNADEYFIYKEPNDNRSVYIIREDMDNNAILYISAQTKEILRRCKIGANTLEFKWNNFEKREDFTFVFNNIGIQFQMQYYDTNYDYGYTENRFVSFKNNDEIGQYSEYQIKKNKSGYFIDARIASDGPSQRYTVEIQANVSHKTMIQNAINFFIISQDINYLCIPFLFGRY